mgnify:CR=1 FL=1
MTVESMQLTVMTGGRIVLDVDVDRVAAEAENGAFVLLPRHVDMVAALAPGLLSATAGDREHLFAVDRGTLVKCGRRVEVATYQAIEGTDVDSLQHELHQSILDLDEHEQRARSAVARIESDVIRGLIGSEPDERR